MSDTKTQYHSVADMVDRALQAKELSIRDLAEKLELTYEHARRIVRGEAVPSKFILKPLCAYLGLDYQEADRLATGERIRKKYGVIADSLTPAKVSGLEPIEKVWGQLTEAQKTDAVTLIQAWARNNRHDKVSK